MVPFLQQHDNLLVNMLTKPQEILYLLKELNTDFSLAVFIHTYLAACTIISAFEA